MVRLEMPSSCRLMVVVAARLHGRRHRRGRRCRRRLLLRLRRRMFAIVLFVG